MKTKFQGSPGGAGIYACVQAVNKSALAVEVTMQGQQQIGKARIIGYALGLAAFIVIAIWKFIVR